MKDKPHILYIDDEKENLTVFKFAFMADYKIYLAQSAAEGLNILKENHPISVIITDQRMPGVSGVQFLEQTIASYPDAIRIIVTGFSDIEAVIDSINKGKVYHFVKKPWEKDEFKSIIDKAHDTYLLRKENKTLVDTLKKANEELDIYAKDLEKKVEERTSEIRLQNSEIHKKNKELELHRNHLEQLVNERTADLEIAKNKAEEASKLKSAFLANMSHEIRTPLNAIIGFSNLLIIPEISENQRIKYFYYIEKSTKSLLQLIDDILDISMIEAKQIEIINHEFKVSDVLSEFYKLYSAEIVNESEAKVELRINTNNTPEDFTLDLDEMRYKQILANLLENAKKYTESGYIEMGIKLANLPNGSPMLITYIKDTGIGIDEKYFDVIFERFRKIETTGNKLYRGAGLGLTISRNLVSMMGGEIWLESTPSKGSTFYFSLPKNKIEVAKVDEPTLEVLEQKKELDLSGKTILIAEDEETNYFLVNTFLRNTGIKLLWAQDGELAVEMVRNNPDICLVLMDIKLPKKTGIEAVLEIKKFSQVRIIAQTAYAMQSDVQKIMESGCDDFIPKPFTKKRFMDKIMQNL